MKVEELLEQIDEMLDNAWSLPLSGGKCAIDANQLRDILDDIRANLPTELRQAQNIVHDRGKIIEDARKEAENIVRSAEERARAMVARDEVMRQAQQRANEMLTQAQQKSREMRKGAGDFAEDVLRRTEETLAKRLGEVRQARQNLRAPAVPPLHPEEAQ